MLAIDLNCDMGEGLGNDEAIMAFVSSVNIACGFHAGSEEMMHATVLSAIKREINIGAHPGFPDKEGFGRRTMQLSPAEIFDCILVQVDALKRIVKSAGANMTHVKPHGAMYNMAAKDIRMAHAIARAVKEIDPGLILYGLSGSNLLKEAVALNLKTASEVFADRTYQEDGSLTPRDLPGAIISDPAEAAAQALKLALQGMVTTTTGKEISLIAETICIHGDTPNALEYARSINYTLKHHHVSIRKP